MKKGLIFASAAVISLVAASMFSGCDAAKEAAGDVAKQCGLECPATGVADGNATISGVASIDSFFGTVVDYNATATLVTDGLAKPLANIQAMVLAKSTSATDIKAAMTAQFGLTGDIKIVAAPPKCEISAKATVEATAKCDATVDPGSVKASCTGSCEADVQVSGGEAKCDASAELKCTTPSVNVACTGGCKGECKMDATAKCEGTCKGDCDGTCEVKGADGKCNGTCTGKCGGTCELSASASCSGTCDGECTATAEPGGCSADAKVSCVVKPPSGSAKVDCSGKCEGEVTPPSASVQCEASAKASAEMKAECTPPSVEVTAAFAASATADQKLEFEAFLVNFKTEIGALIAGLKRADLVLKAGVNVVGSVDDVTAAFQAQVDGDLDLKTSIGLGCAVKELAKVAGSMETSTTALTGQVKASGEFVAAFK